MQHPLERLDSGRQFSEEDELPLSSPSQLALIVRTYERLAMQWETDERCDAWGDAYADQMAEKCWSIAMRAQVALLRMGAEPVDD